MEIRVTCSAMPLDALRRARGECSCGDGWVTYGDSCYLFSNADGMHYVEAEVSVVVAMAG